MNTLLACIAMTAVLVRARPWSALVLRAPWAWLPELALCGYCLGFHVGLLTGLVTGPGTPRGILHAVLLGFGTSLGAGAVTAVLRLLDRAGDALDLWISERLK